jgi:hypothetical protein
LQRCASGEKVLGKHRFDKLFSADEANELIPRLEILIRDLQVQAGTMRKRIADLARFDDKLSQLELPQVVARYPELRTVATRMSEIASEIEQMGCFLKDIDQGLVDFPFLIEAEGDDEDEVVFLCWQYGEQRIVAWHNIESGFGQRQPLPGAAKPLLN